MRRLRKTSKDNADEEYIEPEWMEGLSEQQISAINMWTLYNPRKAGLAVFLNSSFFWSTILGLAACVRSCADARVPRRGAKVGRGHSPHCVRPLRA